MPTVAAPAYAPDHECPPGFVGSCSRRTRSWRRSSPSCGKSRTLGEVRRGCGPARSGAYLLAVVATAPVRFCAGSRPRTVFRRAGSRVRCRPGVGDCGNGGGAWLFAAYTVLVAHGRPSPPGVIVAGYALIGPRLSGSCQAPRSSTFFLDAITFATVIALAELVKTRRAYARIHERASRPAGARARHPGPEGGR